MELREIFSTDFQKAMKRVAKGTQKGSASESSASCVGSTIPTIVGKGVNPGNYCFTVPQKKKKEGQS